MESPGPGAGEPPTPAPGSPDAPATVLDVSRAVNQLHIDLARTRRQVSRGSTQFWWLLLIVSAFCLGFAYTSYIRAGELDPPGA